MPDFFIGLHDAPHVMQFVKGDTRDNYLWYGYVIDLSKQIILFLFSN